MTEHKTNEIDRDAVIEAARNWLEANTPIRWTTEPSDGVEMDISLEELNRRPQLFAERLADFHIAQTQQVAQRAAVPATQNTDLTAALTFGVGQRGERERREELEVIAAALYLGHDDAKEQMDMYRKVYLEK